MILPLLHEALVVLLDPRLLGHQLGLGLLLGPARGRLLVSCVPQLSGRSLPQISRGLPLVHGGQPAAVRTLGSLLTKPVNQINDAMNQLFIPA